MNGLVSMIMTAAATTGVQLPPELSLYKPTNPGPWLKRKVGARWCYRGKYTDGVVKLPSGARYATYRDGWRRIKVAS